MLDYFENKYLQISMWSGVSTKILKNYRSILHTNLQNKHMIVSSSELHAIVILSIMPSVIIKLSRGILFPRINIIYK